MTRRTRILKNVIAGQDFTTAVMQMMVHPQVTEAIAMSNVDFVIVDLEHTGKTIAEAGPCIDMAFAHDVPVIVRVYEKSQHLVEQVLDAGAQGVLVPTIETLDDCLEVVRSAKFAPMGERGFCPVVPARRWLNDFDPSTYTHDANRDTFIGVLIETPKGFANLSEMLQVEGIDAFFLGRADYAVRVGKPIWDPEVTQVMTAALRQITDAGKLCVPLAREDDVADYVRAGARIVQLGFSDASALQSTLSSEAAKLRAIVDATSTASGA
jgi:4-hydroxy-2-oxoheptanedioate aldolase